MKFFFSFASLLSLEKRPNQNGQNISGQDYEMTEQLGEPVWSRDLVTDFHFLRKTGLINNLKFACWLERVLVTWFKSKNNNLP